MFVTNIHMLIHLLIAILNFSPEQLPYGSYFTVDPLNHNLDDNVAAEHLKTVARIIYLVIKRLLPVLMTYL